MADKSLIGHKLDKFSVDVEKGRLRFFAKAIGETDPVYTSEAAAIATLTWAASCTPSSPSCTTPWPMPATC